MDAGDVIPFYQIAGDVDDLALDLRRAGVHPEHAADFVGELRELFADVVFGARLGGVGGGAVGVEPSMDGHPALPCFGDEKRERIVTRRTALRAGEIPAPRLDLRGIQRVALGAHLQKHGVEARRFGRFEKPDRLRFLRLGGLAGVGWEVDVVNGGNPRAAEIRAGGHRQGEGDKCEKKFFHGVSAEACSGLVSMNGRIAPVMTTLEKSGCMAAVPAGQTHEKR